MPTSTSTPSGAPEVPETPIVVPVVGVKRKLTERNYLGVGYIHVFKKDVTDEIVKVQCSEQEYTSLETDDFQPSLTGHTWLHSEGGTYKVDTPDGTLGEDEYCEANGEKIVNLKDATWEKKHQKLELTAIDSKGELDEAKLKIELK